MLGEYGQVDFIKWLEDSGFFLTLDWLVFWLEFLLAVSECTMVKLFTVMIGIYSSVSKYCTSTHTHTLCSCLFPACRS
jgi:hypothetical protein